MTKLMAILVSAVFSITAHAADHRNLEEDLPIVIEDAYPIPEGAIEGQLSSKVIQLRDRTYVLELDPSVDWGIFKNTQISFSVQNLVNLNSLARPGDIVTLKISGLYNFNQESLGLPAFAVGPSVDVPINGDDGDPSARFALPVIVTRTFGTVRVHGNAALVVRIGSAPDLKTLGYTAAAALDYPLNFQTSLLLGATTESSEHGGFSNSNLFQLGIRRQISQNAVLSIGVGSGLGIGNNPDQPRFMMTIGIQGNFN